MLSIKNIMNKIINSHYTYMDFSQAYLIHLSIEVFRYLVLVVTYIYYETFLALSGIVYGYILNIIIIILSKLHPLIQPRIFLFCIYNYVNLIKCYTNKKFIKFHNV